MAARPNDRRRKLTALKVDRYDGQSIFIGNELRYELGGYLGGGTAGVVYEALCLQSAKHVAIKILNPIGYKLMPTSLLSRCVVAIKGRQMEPEVATGQQPMRNEHVWWLVHQSSKQAIAAYEDPRSGAFRELTLPRCIEVWGIDFAFPANDKEPDVFANDVESYCEVNVKGQVYQIPRMPKKFVKFARSRSSIYREISNMSSLGTHVNVLRLDEALELHQDSKCTIFLVLELAAGGELFDRIKLDCGTDEPTARLYFKQLISGIAFCHGSGVCHRDLKPENLLLADNEENSTLKIADFGLSAIFSIADDIGNGNTGQSIRRLRSVVGSPHYVAPEVLQDTGQGYDGAKADAWSSGIILYAMLAGSLPFGKDLLKCIRYEKFKKWSFVTKYNDDAEDPANEVEFPEWFFPSHFSQDAKSLIAQLIYPDPCLRLSVDEAMGHRWVILEQQKSPVLVAPEPPSADLSPALATLKVSPLNPTLSSTVPRKDATWAGSHIVRSHNNVAGGSGVKATTLLSVNSQLPSMAAPSPNKPNLSIQPRALVHPGYMPPLDEGTPANSPRPVVVSSSWCRRCGRGNCTCDHTWNPNQTLKQQQQQQQVPKESKEDDQRDALTPVTPLLDGLDGDASAFEPLSLTTW
ncbi:CAMK protein kinase [Saprolegnia parasitica CBS 223.65]|uniref:non-specific serine/threonine protein kinase n=1 Tax=Saprolegnia parasitica (strain CBS 223.65) TaxID=695850 RepID=A0A067CNA7_SAPPC|nr:CAMK protein kinase [Saprolegnia parasitica CBS 223.65]KDO28292.1 CAMK protein kinase [Saprolegnia parasitica CBS 223.65]|eukprot:XP_012201112.1 CAMK protein kinase [Saprolegnia parasitica CBS 223.65]